MTAWALEPGPSRSGWLCLTTVHAMAMLALCIALCQLLDRVGIQPLPAVTTAYSDVTTTDSDVDSTETCYSTDFWLTLTALLSVVLMTGVCHSFLYHQRMVKSRRRIVFHNDGAIQVFPLENGNPPRNHTSATTMSRERATVVSPAIVNRWLVRLKLHDTESGTRHLVIWRDSVSECDYRRLSASLQTLAG